MAPKGVRLLVLMATPGLTLYRFTAIPAHEECEARRGEHHNLSNLFGSILMVSSFLSGVKSPHHSGSDTQLVDGHRLGKHFFAFISTRRQFHRSRRLHCLPRLWTGF